MNTKVQFLIQLKVKTVIDNDKRIWGRQIDKELFYYGTIRL